MMGTMVTESDLTYLWPRHDWLISRVLDCEFDEV